MVRIKERYLLVNILYPGDLGRETTTNNGNDNSNSKRVPDVVVLNQPTTDDLTPQKLLRGIRTEVANLFGDYGSGAIEGGGGGLVVKYLSPATSTFILRTSRTHYRLVWAALTMMNCVPVSNGKECVFRVMHVSGTIRRVEERAIQLSRNMMLAVKDEVVDKEKGAVDALLGRPKRTPQVPTIADVMDVDDESGDEEMQDYDSDG